MVIGIDASRANQREKTGTEWYSWHLIRALAPLLRQHTLKLYTREALETGLQNLGPHLQEVILRWPPGILWSHLRLSWELWRHQPDVLFVPADTVPLVHPPRTVTTIHDVGFERFPELYRRTSVQRRLGWLRPLIHLLVRIFTLGRYSASEVDYHRWSVRHALRSSQTILTVSEFSKKEIVETLGADPKAIVVTHLGVKQPVEYDQIDQAAAQAVLLRLGLNKPFFLFLGRLESKKNIGQIIRGYTAYRQLVQEPLDLVLAGGPGNGWAEVEPLVRAAGDCIHVLGWQASEVISVLQKSARTFIFLSEYEGFGLPPLESLSAGVPVLASRAGSLPEVLGDCALYVDHQDIHDIAHGLHLITTDEALRSRLRVCGRSRVIQFTWDRTAAITAKMMTGE